MLLTKWNDIEDWIKTNAFRRVVVRANDRLASSDGEQRTNDVLFDTKNVTLASFDEKLQHLRWVLEHSDRKVYATGFQSESAGTGGMIAEMRLENVQAPQMSYPVGMPGVGAPVDEQSIIDRVRKEVKAEYDMLELERKRKEFEAERKEFMDTKNGIMGLLVEYGKPILGAMVASGRRSMVAGIDQPGHTEAEPIVPTPGTEVQEAEEVEESPFTDEEADEMCDLMARFKKVEPEYMQLLRSVVVMAESGDSTYTMARGFLIKK